MSLRLLIAAALLAVSQVAWAQGQRTRTSTTTLWLPSRPTSAGNNIYASVITAAPETTEYLLACATTFRSPYPSSCGDFAGVTLTHADGTMRIKFAYVQSVCVTATSRIFHFIFLFPNPRNLVMLTLVLSLCPTGPTRTIATGGNRPPATSLGPVKRHHQPPC